MSTLCMIYNVWKQINKLKQVTHKGRGNCNDMSDFFLVISIFYVFVYLFSLDRG